MRTIHITAPTIGNKATLLNRAEVSLGRSHAKRLVGRRGRGPQGGEGKFKLTLGAKTKEDQSAAICYAKERIATQRRCHEKLSPVFKS